MRGIKRFPIGGTHLPENKDLTTNIPIQSLPDPDYAAIPLKQHIGAPAKAIVAVGDKVTVGQVIGESSGGISISARVHASINGVVTSFDLYQLNAATSVECVIIKRTGVSSVGSQALNAAGPSDPVPDADSVQSMVRDAGIVGLGGAGFPSHLKLVVNQQYPIDSVIINGAECEPYITTDDRLIQEQTAQLFRGLEIIRQTVGARHGYAACEINKPAAIQCLQKEAERWPHLQAVRLDTRYPHGAEKHLVKAVLNREIPIRSLPMAVGAVVNNVQTAIAIAQAVDNRQPLTHRVLTISGTKAARPGNFLIPLGMSIRDALQASGNLTKENFKLVIGGPMTGTLTGNMDQPIVKGTSGLVLMAEEEYADRSSEVCIRCAKCVSVCPMYLQPNRITAFIINDMLEDAEEFGLINCILCGACSFICPSRRPLVQWLIQGKTQSEQRAFELKQDIK